MEVLTIKIAILGIRGIPANYGGFETFAEELAPRLAEKGHDVTVYGRSNNIDYPEKYYKGVRLVILPTISHKYLDTIVHTFLSCMHSLFCSYDAVLICNGANSILSWIPKLSGAKVAVNVDGIERQRKKWNRLGRIWYLLGEYVATKLPDEMVSDAAVIEKYYLEKYGAKSTMIPYGASCTKAVTREYLAKFEVLPQEYVLYVSRFEPENNIHVVIQAFKKVKTDKKLVIVGDAPYSTEYKEYLHKLAAEDSRVILTGFVYGAGYKEFQSHAYCYVQATEVGGTHPALIEAMGFGNCVIANGTPENIEVVGNAGIIYQKNDVDDLACQLQDVLDNPAKIEAYQARALQKVANEYSWAAVTDKYEQLFAKMTVKK